MLEAGSVPLVLLAWALRAEYEGAGWMLREPNSVLRASVEYWPSSEPVTSSISVAAPNKRKL